MCRNTDLARGRYKCTESIYVLHIPVLYTEHFVKLVRKAYIDRFERHISTGSKGIYRQVRKAYIDRFERHISTAGRCVAAGHAVGSEAATGAAKPPAGSAQPTPPASQS
ncbi:hypothetical protein NQ317_004877 [Molorchus minor]|uniref:Uncharacterized protein n=1 Tax=Molorchus minor TaxID=1323400 RepID=A0ABQ9JHD9_9CUCU|nr:hypothetical protein NQ317_004877 [Molorchus minor]